MIERELLTQEIEKLQRIIKEKDSETEQLIVFIKKTLQGFGVSDFTDMEHIGTKLMKGIPGIMADSIFPNKLKRRFAHFEDTTALFKKHAHHFTSSQTSAPDNKKLR